MYLDDILNSMKRILEYAEGYSYIDFKKDYKTVDAVIRNFEVIGEASKNIPQEIRDKYSEVPWDEMYLLRNKISHEYFGIVYEIIWDLVSNYIPGNITQIEGIIKEEF